MSEVYPVLSRILHWTMAVLIFAMLFIGIAMVASLSDYGRLVAIHRPLGILILVLAAVRLVNRLFQPPPPLPQGMPALLSGAARGSHYLLYLLMFALPLVGWGMLSAAAYPIVFIGALHLPPILPHDDALYAVLRGLHTVLAFVLFATVLAHLGAALMHALIFRDGVFQSMATGRISVPPRTVTSDRAAPTAIGTAGAETLPNQSNWQLAEETTHLDERLDEALEETFPASDPIAVGVQRLPETASSNPPDVRVESPPP